MKAYLLAFIIGIFNPIIVPPPEAMIGFTVEEDMPGNITIYYDVSWPQDGKWDIAYLHPIVGIIPLKNCRNNKWERDRMTMTVTNCPNSLKPYNYVVMREPNAVKRPYQMIETLYKMACFKSRCPSMSDR